MFFQHASSNNNDFGQNKPDCVSTSWACYYIAAVTLKESTCHAACL